MNCKQGDLAVMVRSNNGNEGRIVRCLRFVGKVPGWIGDDRWETDTELVGFKGGRSRCQRDSYLRPIRDNDGEDESFAWAGKPQRVMEECDVHD